MSETAPQCVGATKVEEGFVYFFYFIKHVKVCDELRSSFGIRVRGFSVLGRTLTVTRYNSIFPRIRSKILQQLQTRIPGSSYLGDSTLLSSWCLSRGSGGGFFFSQINFCFYIHSWSESENLHDDLCVWSRDSWNSHVLFHQGFGSFGLLVREPQVEDPVHQDPSVACEVQGLGVVDDLVVRVWVQQHRHVASGDTHLWMWRTVVFTPCNHNNHVTSP